MLHVEYTIRPPGLIRARGLKQPPLNARQFHQIRRGDPPSRFRPFAQDPGVRARHIDKRRIKWSLWANPRRLG